MRDPRITLADQFTRDTLHKYNITEFAGIEKNSDLYNYVDMYNDLFTDTIRNWYEMRLDHPFFILFKICQEEINEDAYCESRELFDHRVKSLINKVKVINGES